MDPIATPATTAVQNSVTAYPPLGALGPPWTDRATNRRRSRRYSRSQTRHSDPDGPEPGPPRTSSPTSLQDEPQSESGRTQCQPDNLPSAPRVLAPTSLPSRHQEIRATGGHHPPQSVGQIDGQRTRRRGHRADVDGHARD